MRGKVLSDEQIDHFIDRGWVRLSEAFPRTSALKAQDYLWNKVEERGVKRADETTWTIPMVHIKEAYDDGPFPGCQTQRLTDAIADLVGSGNWIHESENPTWGWWPVNFSQGADKPWVVPTTGWHWDGIHFKHFVDAPDQGLLLLPMFSDTVPQGGATTIAEGSHQVTARFLASHPEGLDLGDAIRQCVMSHPWLSMLTDHTPLPDGADRNAFFMDQEYVDADGSRLKVVEAVASAGDVYMCHPFLFHAAAPNLRHTPRFMCNRTVPLKRKVRLTGDQEDITPLEQSIRCSLSR